jgi:hypothetical protein
VKRAIGTLAVAWLVAACAESIPSTPPGVTAQASSSDAAEGRWQRLDLPNGDASFSDVAATEHDVVIVGGRAMGPVAWTSHDGGAWTFEQLAPEGALPDTAIALGDRVVVVGFMQTKRCAPHPAANVFWLRDPDGLWTFAPFDKLFCAGGESAPLVARADGRLAMVGTESPDISFAWFSNDGLTWVDRPIRRDAYPQSITAVAGGFAAIGIFNGGDWWVGRGDGRNAWTIAPLPNTPPDAFPMGLADRGAGLIAWFVTGGREIGALTTETGEVWRSTELQGMAGAAPSRVIRTANGYVALAELEPDARPAMFVSRDGVRWRRVAGPIDDRPGNYVRLAISGERAILLGDVRVGDEGTPMAWTGPARLFAP